MMRIDIHHAKDWRLRSWLTQKRKALAGNRGGLARLMQEHLEHDIALIRAEIDRRKQPTVTRR